MKTIGCEVDGEECAYFIWAIIIKGCIVSILCIFMDNNIKLFINE